MDNNNKKTNKERTTSIGGQAVLEGVMMRGASAMATAVRDEDGIIRLETRRVKPTKKRHLIFRLPIIRGVVNFICSLVDGSRVLMRSAEVYGESEPTKFEKWMSERLKINLMSVITTISMLIGVVLAVFLFIYLPQFVRTFLEGLIGKPFGIWAKNFIEGGLKLLIFLCYILLVSLMKDIKRTFMYHGAEHKTISCYESGKELTIENAKNCSRIHDRCGTTFIVLVMLISILLFATVESLIGQNVEKLYRVGLKVIMLPVVAGLSYELLKLLAKTKSKLVLPLKVPGMLLQKITTREPTDDMLEVAITAFNKVVEMDNDPTIIEQDFVLPEKRKVLLEKVKCELSKNGIDEGAEAEWIISLTINCKRDQLNSDDLVSPKNVEKIWKIVNERITKRPLWYCMGDTEFYGHIIKVDERVLIPRPETELLAENAIKCLDESKSVLDLCTGSGAIAITLKLETNAKVFAVDISDDALELARENAKNLLADVEFIKSDMFSALSGHKFDLIVSNPPYIKSEDISALQDEVKHFEPRMALDGGEDGLDFYRIIAENAKDYLNENGVLLLECGIGLAEEIKRLLKGFSRVEILKDYENIDRIIKAVL